MNKNELEEYQNKLMSGAKGTMKLGIVTGVGGAIVGNMGNMGSQTAPVTGAVNSALGLAAVGNMAAIGMSILPVQNKKKISKKNGNPMDNPAAYF